MGFLSKKVFMTTLLVYVCIQHTLFYERGICLIFVKELRTRIVSYKNVSISIKESIDKTLTTLLVSPSL